MIEMPTIEQEIVDKFSRLDSKAQSRVLSRLQNKTKASQPAFDSTFDYDAWFKRVDALQEQMRNENGGEYPQIDAVQLIRDIRDEEDE